MRARGRIHASPVLWGLVLGAALAAGLVACAGQPARMASSDIELRKKEIQDYWMQIRDWRVDRGWRPDPFAGQITPSGARCETIKEPATDTCQDICTLKDAICDNKDSICRIAKQLDGDTWADGKCRSARASCEEARQRCCECTVKEQSSAAPAVQGTP